MSIFGTHFYARGVQSLSKNGGISIEEGYSAMLDGVPLLNVVRVSDTELQAIVPHGLPAGPHALTVIGPYGLSGTIAQGWFASDLPAAQLVASASAPAQVSTGQTFTLLVAVSNTGGVTARGVSPSVLLGGTGGASLAAAPPAQDIPGGESRTFSWQTLASQAGTLSVSGGAAGTDEVSQRPVASTPASAQTLIEQHSALEAAAVAPAQLTFSLGQSVALTLVVTNTGSATALGVSFADPAGIAPQLQLVSSPSPQDIPGGMTSRSFTWIYQAAQPGQAAPANSGGAGTDENDALPVYAPSASWPGLTIETPAQIAGAAIATPSPITVQQTFSVALRVTNTGQAAAISVTPSLRQSGSGTASVVTAPSSADIPGGGTADFVWTLTGTAAGSLALSLDAAAMDGNSGATAQMPTAAAGPVLVQTPPALSGTASATPTQASTGQPIQLELAVSNAGQATAAAVLPTDPVVSGTGARLLSAPSAQDVPGGAARSFFWTYAVDTAGSVDFSVSASGHDQNNGAAVQLATTMSNAVAVKTAAFIEASATVSPVQVSTGQDVTLRTDVANVGEAGALAVSCAATPSGTATVTLTSSPAAQDIPAQTSRSYSWTFHTTSPGTVSFSVSASGTDALSGTVITATANAGPATVQSPASLTSAAQLTPAQASTGQTMTFRLDVTNTGQATAAGVTAIANGGTGIATQTGSPQPQDIPGGATRSFLWTYQATAAGPLQLSGSASGADANSGAAVSTGPSTASANVQTQASLTGVLRLSQAKVSVGQQPQLFLDVTNSGQATASQFTPTAPAPSGSGTQIVASPAPADVPGGATVTFPWTLSAGAAGTVTFTVGGSATDANSSVTVPLPTATSPQLLVQTPPRLSAVVRLSLTQVDLGQSFQLLVDVTNAGQADAAVDPGKVQLDQSGAGHATITLAPGTQTVPGGTTRTFAWTLSPDATGTVRFTVHLDATDVNSNAAVDPSPPTSPTLLIQKPAALSAVIAATPATANTGQSLSVTMTVKNAGEATAQAVTPALSIGGVGATLVSGPTPPGATVSGGSAQVFTWNLQGNATGTVTFSGTASGTDVNTGQTVSASTATAANVTVQRPAVLSGAFAALPASINVGQALQLTLTATNSGDSAANAVAPAIVLSGNGSASLSSGAAPSSATIAGHTGQAFAFTYAGSVPGQVIFNGSASGTDAIDGRTVTSPSIASSTVTVQTPSAISARLVIPKTIPLGDTFAAALTVSNSGDATVNLAVPANPSIVPGSTGNASLVSGPSPPSAMTLAGHSDQTFTWSFSATGEGSLQLQAQISGSDSNDGTARTASATSAVAPVAEVVAIATDPFGDGSAFSYLFDFSGQLWLGPSSTGAGAVRMNADGSGAQAVQWQLEHSTAASNTFYRNGLAHTIGAKGCTSNTAGCGPDNESGRALFFRGVVGGTEWLGLAGAHVNSGSDYARFVYFTNGGFPLASGGYTDFAYNDLSGAIASSAVGLTSAAVFHDRVYLGFLDQGGPALEQLSTMPSLPGAGSSAVTDMGATLMPGIGGGAMIDSMAVFGPSSGDGLYLANAQGFTRTTASNPGVCQIVLLLLLDCSDWTDVTPSALAYTAKVALTTTKTSDLEPADRTVPAFATFGGRLYAARNTTTGPQLWSCDPGRSGSATQCDSGDWFLVAPNTSGDSQATQFNDPNNASVTFLAATSQHLYVGFNNSVRGVVLYRTANTAAAANTDFTGRLGCSAPSSGCAGLGGDGLGAGLTHFYDGRALTLGGTEYLYLASGTGTSPVRIYRTNP